MATEFASPYRAVRADEVVATVSRTEEGIVVRAAGVLDGEGLLRLRFLLEDLIDGQGNRRVTLDLAGVTACGPGLGSVLEAMDTLAVRHGGRFDVLTGEARVAAGASRSLLDA